jgi:hypothetical protein
MVLATVERETGGQETWLGEGRLETDFAVESPRKLWKSPRRLRRAEDLLLSGIDLKHPLLLDVVLIQKVEFLI